MGPGMVCVSVRVSVRIRAPVCVHSRMRAVAFTGTPGPPLQDGTVHFALPALHVLQWPFAVRPQSLRSYYPRWAAGECSFRCTEYLRAFARHAQPCQTLLPGLPSRARAGVRALGLAPSTAVEATELLPNGY